MPSTPPTTTPTIGITKNPAIAPSAPTTSVVTGAPRAPAERAGRTYLVTVPTASSTVSTPRTAQRVAPPPSAIVHHRPAAQMSSSPGSTGSRMPTIPTIMTRPTSTCASPLMPLPTGTAVRPPPAAGVPRWSAAHPAPPGPRTQRVRGADAAQVQRHQDQSDEQQGLRGERVPDVLVRPVEDQREGEHHRAGNCEHRPSLSGEAPV